jgi:hypothetical protein
MTRVAETPIRLGPALAVATAVMLLTWPWIQGPAAVGLACFAGTLVSSVISDRQGRQALAWGRALAQGALVGVVAGLMVRWLTI